MVRRGDRISPPCAECQAAVVSRVARRGQVAVRENVRKVQRRRQGDLGVEPRLVACRSLDFFDGIRRAIGIQVSTIHAEGALRQEACGGVSVGVIRRRGGRGGRRGENLRALQLLEVATDFPASIRRGMDVEIHRAHHRLVFDVVRDLCRRVGSARFDDPEPCPVLLA